MIDLICHFCRMGVWGAVVCLLGAAAYAQTAEMPVQEDKLAELRAALLNTPDDTALLCKLGNYYIQMGQADSAQNIFEQANKLVPNMPEALVGLGRVFMDLKFRPKKALGYFENAEEADSISADIQGLLGRAYLDAGQTDRAERAAIRALKIDPKYAPAYLLRAQIYQKQNNTEAALGYFEKYLEFEPEDHTPVVGFLMGFLKEKDFVHVQKIASRMKGIAAYPLLAQVRQHWGDHEGAFAYFDAYIKTLPEKEQAFFYDISLVGTSQEVTAYQTVTPENKEVFLNSFWLKKDPFKTSGGTMRRAEHYRRVWYSRTFYGKKKWPWDRRGDVYIRYGEPDYQSNWREMNAKVPLKVQRVQEQMAFQLYGRRGLDVNYVGPVFPIRTERDDPKQNRPLDDPGFVEVGLLSWKPITVGSEWAAVPWEVWVYADVENGLEVAFTDEFHTGNYGYAPVPNLTLEEIRQIADYDRGSPLTFVQRMTSFSPASRVASVASKMPERYDISGLEPLNFYYDPLAFRGRNGKTQLQIDFGLPVDAVFLSGDPSDTTVLVERRIALMNERSVEVARHKKDVAVPFTSAIRGKNLLARDRVHLELAAGSYELAVQMWRLNTDILGVYRQAVDLYDFTGDGLMLSDLQVAQMIHEIDEKSDPKFARGKWMIVTSPSRTFYSGDPVFVYFEIYNLNRNAFGATRYEVSFTIGAKEATTLTQAKIRKKDGESVAVQYEQTGTDTWIADYVELNVGPVRPGRYVLHMTVKDHISGQTASREGVFRVVGR